MERNEERRGEQEKRVPIRAAVELAENRDDSFEADAINLSRGGMSLRSQCLPDIGARLWCRFEHPPSGSVIEAEGEVVWSQIEGEAGEIGLAFTSLDPATELLIEQIIAQHGAPTASGEAIDPGERDRMAAELDAQDLPALAHEEQAASEALPPRSSSLPPAPRAPVANLSLEGIPEPLSAQVAELSTDYAVFEQVLPLLKLGRPVSADAPDLLDRRGVIAGVELRMMGHVPTLAVIVEFTDGATGEKSYGEASFSGTDLPVLPSDTEPDLEAPVPAEAEPASEYKRVTAAEFSASPAPSQPRHEGGGAPSKPQQLALDVAPAPRVARAVPEPELAPESEPELREEPVPPVLASTPGVEQRPSSRGDVAAAQPAARSSRLDPTQVVSLPDDADEDVSLDDPFAPAPPPWKPYALAAIRALHAVARVLLTIAKQCGRMLGASGVAALPHVRLLLLRARTLLAKSGAALGPKLGAARRLASAQLGRKRRRTTGGGATAARERESSDTGSLLRTLGIGALVSAIAGLGVYAALPTAEPELELHRAIAPEGEAGLSGGEPALPLEPASAEAPQATEEPAMPMPSAASVPAGSAFAVDVRERARPKPAATAAPSAPKAPAAAAAPAATKPAPRALRFGAATAPSRAQTFALRMSKPITSISGSSDAGGFTVVVMGSLSLDRAGPIGAAHKGVARAMVLNKGDRSELTIRFADGKRPAYQVRGDGTTLYVVIEDV